MPIAIGHELRTLGGVRQQALHVGSRGGGLQQVVVKAIEPIQTDGAVAPLLMVGLHSVHGDEVLGR